MRLIHYHPDDYIDGITGFMLKSIFEEKYNIKLEVLSFVDFDLFESEIKTKPEVIIVHCHDDKRNFEVIRQITKCIKNNNDNCLVFVDYNWNAGRQYFIENIHGYETDLLITSSAGMFILSDEHFQKLDIFIKHFRQK